MGKVSYSGKSIEELVAEYDELACALGETPWNRTNEISKSYLPGAYRDRKMPANFLQKIAN